MATTSTRRTTSDPARLAGFAIVALTASTILVLLSTHRATFAPMLVLVAVGLFAGASLVPGSTPVTSNTRQAAPVPLIVSAALFGFILFGSASSAEFARGGYLLLLSVVAAGWFLLASAPFAARPR